MKKISSIFALLLSTVSFAEGANPFLAFEGTYGIEESNCQHGYHQGVKVVEIKRNSNDAMIHFIKEGSSVGIPLLNGYNGMGCQMNVFSTDFADVKGAIALCYMVDNFKSSNQIFKIEKLLSPNKYLLSFESSTLGRMRNELTQSGCFYRFTGR